MELYLKETVTKKKVQLNTYYKWSITISAELPDQKMLMNT